MSTFTNPPASRRLGWSSLGSAILVVALFASAFLWNVAPYWEVNPQYSFGWLVPAICIVLFVRRWRCRPAPRPVAWPPAKLLLAAIAFVFFPTWLVVQPNPDWRMVTWALALELVAVSLCTIYFCGGSSWVRHFAFPVVFILTAVPWPFGIEWALVQNLMRWVAAIAVEILTWFNFAALQHGNLIEVRTGTLGVDEACSGVRSLQATIMVSLFLGEFYWLRPSRRVLLVVVGVALAFTCNVGRTLLLSIVAARDGIDAIGHWHDPAGYTILTLCLLGVWAVVWIVGFGTPPEVQTGYQDQPHTLPGGLFAGLMVWLLFSMAATEAWYRFHEGGEKLRWSLRWPESRKSFTDLPVPERAKDLLLYDEGRTASWEQPDGTIWYVSFFRWNAGSSRSRVVPRSHRPEICLPASGYTMENDYGTRGFRVKGLDIPFHSYRFQKGGHALRIFSCMWQDRAKAGQSAATAVEWNRLVGLGFVLRGERNLSQQVMEVALTGYDTEAAAEGALQAELEEMIVR